MKATRVLVFVLVLSLVGQVASAASPGALLLRQEINRLRVASESDAGLSPEAALAFNRALLQGGVTLADVQSYLREQLTAREYREFERQLEGSLRGIDPQSLTGDEMAEVVRGAAASAFSEGLTWSSCPGKTIGGIALVAAGVALLVYTVVKGVQADRVDARYEASRPGEQDIRDQYEYLIAHAQTYAEAQSIKDERDRVLLDYVVNVSGPLRHEWNDLYGQSIIGGFGAVGALVPGGILLYKASRCY